MKTSISFALSFLQVCWVPDLGKGKSTNKKIFILTLRKKVFLSYHINEYMNLLEGRMEFLNGIVG